MSRTKRHSKRHRKKASRKAARKANRRASKAKAGQKAGSIAIHSRLPGLEGAELGAMEVVVDTRRKESHPAMITVAVHNKEHKRAVVWSIETGFGGQPARAGYQVVSDGELDQVPETEWIIELGAAPATGPVS